MPPLGAVEPERPEAVQAEADPLRLRSDASLARARRELEEALESGGEPRDAASGQFVGDPRLQGEPACPVLGAQASHVAVVVVRVDEAGEGRLVQHVGRPAGAAALRGERAGEPLGDDPPREADGRREALRRRAGVQHVVGRERLERADRATVVAELAVVVVLDDEAAGAFRPAHDLEPPCGAERDADRELVRRGEEHRVHVSAAASITAPPASTGMATGASPAARMISRCASCPTSSTAIRRAPVDASARHASPRSSPNPRATTVRSTVATTPRTRPR